MEYRKLSRKEVGRFLLAIGIGAYALAIVQFINASVPDENGRWSSLFSFIYSHLGNSGLVIFWVLLGSFLIFKGWHHAREN